MSYVYEITDIGQFHDIIDNSLNSIIVIDFYATWCGPCKAIKPKYEMLAETYAHLDVLFLSTDIEKVPLLAEKFVITSMPTFIIIHKNEVKKKIMGGDIKAIDFALDLILTTSA